MNGGPVSHTVPPTDTSAPPVTISGAGSGLNPVCALRDVTPVPVCLSPHPSSVSPSSCCHLKTVSATRGHRGS